MVPINPPPNEQQDSAFYRPPPTGNLYAPPPQNYDGNFNPYLQQPHSFQLPSNNPYSVKEGKTKKFEKS